MKPIKVPTDLLSEPFNNKALCMNGLSVVDSCYYDRTTTGSMYLEEHVIFYVLKGKATLYYGKQAYTVGQDEFILLKRATMYPFIKEGIAQGCTSTFHGILFCLKDELLADFIRMARIHPKASVSYEPVTKKATGRLKAFTRSLIPYFEEEENIDNGLLRLKIMELLYDVMHTDAGVWQQIMALGCPSRKDIAKVLEDNFLNPISVPELAYLSGRSLSGFKREFQSLYHMPPTLWIRKRRLEYALRLLKTTASSVADVCYASGFENPTHVTRLFKGEFGMPPSQVEHTSNG